MPSDIFALLNGLSYFFFLIWYLPLIVDLKRVKLIDAHAVLPDGFAAVLIGDIFRKPVIVTIHGGDLYKNVTNFWNRWMIKYTLHKSSAVICVSEKLKILAQTVYSSPREGKYFVIPTGFDEGKFRPVAAEIARSKLNLATDLKIVLFVGNLVKVKGLPCLIEAAKILQNRKERTECFIIGDGDLRSYLGTMVKEMELEKTVYLVGEVTHDRIPFWINGCDLLVLPSLNEGLPTVLLEAFACGKPVVASNVGGISEVVVDGENGFLVIPENPRILAEKILKALEKKWDRERITNTGHDYSWRAIADRLYATYETVTKEA